MTETERALAKLVYLRQQVDALRAIPTEASGELSPWVARGVRYSVQTGVEAMIDVCYRLSAKRLRHAPGSAHDALDALLKAGLLPRAHASAWHQLIGLRNRLVHGYEEIADPRLLADVKTGLADFEAFLAAAAPLVGAPLPAEPGHQGDSFGPS